MPAWRPVRSPSRRWEKKSSGLQLVQRSAPRPRRRRLAPAAPRATAGRSSMRPSATPSRSANSRQHLLAHLVAAGPDPGPDRGGLGPDRLGRASRAIPPASPRQPPWAIATPPGPARATGRQSATITSGASPGWSVAWASTSSGLGTRLGEDPRLLRRRRASAARRRGPGGPSARSRARCPSAAARRRRFSTTRPRLVPGLDRDVEGLVGRLADAADAGRERRSRAGQLGLEPANAVLLSATPSGSG